MMHLLLIESDNNIGDCLKDFFEEDCGYQVMWSRRDNEAKNILSLSWSHTFDCVLLGTVLPQGLDILQSLRVWDKTTPVVVISSGDYGEDQAYFEKGANQVFSRPFELDSIAICIEAHLRQQIDEREAKKLGSYWIPGAWTTESLAVTSEQPQCCYY